MVATLSKSQAELPRLVEIASQGEDVVITVEGKPKARLTRAEIAPDTGGTDVTVPVQQLAALREEYHTGKTGPTGDQILEKSRADRPGPRYSEREHSLPRRFVLSCDVSYTTPRRFCTCSSGTPFVSITMVLTQMSCRTIMPQKKRKT